MPRRAGGRTELDVDPATLNWLLYARESEDQEGDAEQVTNQITDLRSFVGQIGGTIGSEYVENDTSAFRKVRVPLPDGTYGYRVVRPVWTERWPSCDGATTTHSPCRISIENA
jgi:hypothetical protein